MNMDDFVLKYNKLKRPTFELETDETYAESNGITWLKHDTTKDKSTSERFIHNSYPTFTTMTQLDIYFLH